MIRRRTLRVVLWAWVILALALAVGRAGADGSTQPHETHDELVAGRP